MVAAVYVVVIFHHPDSSLPVKSESNWLTDVGLGGIDGDVEFVVDFHLCDSFFRSEKGRIARFKFLAENEGRSQRKAG